GPIAGKPAPTMIQLFVSFLLTHITCGSGLARDGVSADDTKLPGLTPAVHTHKSSLPPSYTRHRPVHCSRLSPATVLQPNTADTAHRASRPVRFSHGRSGSTAVAVRG